MTTMMRRSTLETLGLGSVHGVLKGGRLPLSAEAAVEAVFGPPGDRGALVVSGGNGVVGAGKCMQLGARLQPFGIPVVALDFPNAPDGLGRQYPGLVRAFGPERAAQIMSNVVRMSYDGKHLPQALAAFKPRFLLEAVPEVLSIKKAHYEVFRGAYPGIEIRSVTSGFPSKELGVGVAHPAFPHEINKLWEIVESEPSDVTRMLWALGLVPMEVSDHWAFVLDVLFCGITGAAARYHEASNMPFWKVDKYVRKVFGPNPFRAHDAIGAKGANFLTWSCLHHLSEQYGPLFAPPTSLVDRKDSGQDWYTPNHFRPVVGWSMQGDDEELFETAILGPLVQMTSLMVHEGRSHLAQMNAIGELCAQFRRGVLAVIRDHGVERSIAAVQSYHRFHPEAAESPWFPDALDAVESAEWQQLYVNAEHDGRVGVVSISREAYNHDVNAELNRALDWLVEAGIERLVVGGDFHLQTQMTGADTADFFPAVEDAAKGVDVSLSWSRTARRLADDFAVSVGLITGKRCLGGFLELMLHCHYLIADEAAALGMPEVTLPVVPGMEGCHWPFRRTSSAEWPLLFQLLLEGRSVRAATAVGWLVDWAGPVNEAISTAWRVADGGDHGLTRRALETGPLQGVCDAMPTLHGASTQITEQGRDAIVECVRAATFVPLAEAIEVQARHSGGFMTSKACRAGFIGQAYTKTMKV